MDGNRLSWDEMLRVPVEELPKYSHVPVRILPDAGALFEYLARYTADLIRDHLNSPIPLRIVWPCGR